MLFRSVSTDRDTKSKKKSGVSFAQIAISIGESRFAVNIAIFCLSIVLFVWRFSSYVKSIVCSKCKGGEWRRVRTKSGDADNKAIRSSRNILPSESGDIRLKQRNRSPNSVVSFV